MGLRGAYSAGRAAALSGVPKATVHYWARKEILVPSVSAERIRLWSYSDLLALRVIAWLRATKTAPDGQAIAPTTMTAVRTGLRELSNIDLALWTEEGSPNIAVNRGGRVVLNATPPPKHPDGQAGLDADTLDLLRPLAIGQLVRGPDLVTPRPRLRIVPGKLAGAPHVHRTRIETEALAALRRRGLTVGKITALYPAIDTAEVEDALDLESELQPDLALAA
jgi:uncharacterized protein (DUF433 family)